MIPLTQGIGIAAIAFFAEYIDSSLGMGYGTTLTPVLFLMGLKPLEVIPAVLISEFLTGIIAGFTHHRMGNVDFKPQPGGKIPIHLKIALLLATCSIVGTIAAVLIAVRLPKFWLTMFIGVIISAMGFVILFTINKTYGFSWRKITILGLIASFNKGLSAGGYGPIVTGGQLLSGVNTKNTVGITSLAEGLTCFVGIVMYFIMVPDLNLKIAPYNIIGALLSVPFAAMAVKTADSKRLKMTIGILTLMLGILTIAKLAVP